MSGAFPYQDMRCVGAFQVGPSFIEFLIFSDLTPFHSSLFDSQFQIHVADDSPLPRATALAAALSPHRSRNVRSANSRLPSCTLFLLTPTSAPRHHSTYSYLLFVLRCSPEASPFPSSILLLFHRVLIHSRTSRSLAD
jgi:hypothetical protein